MDSIELTEALQTLKGPKTRGVYPADRIPRVLAKPAVIIANEQDHTLPGSHWVAMYFSRNGRAVFFDSYGRPPQRKLFTNRLKINSARFEWNKKKLQSDFSSVCGQWAFIFLTYMNRGFSLREFLKMFSKNTNKNDKLIAKLYKKYKQKYMAKNRKRRFNAYYGKGIRNVKYVQCCMPAYLTN